MTTRAAATVRALERRLDAVFGADGNPLRQLGALAFLLLWVVVVSGFYIYIFYETSVDGAYRSVQALSQDQPWIGGLMRSAHRYASDAFVVVTLLHLAREWMLGRFNGFRWFSWISGVPLLWLTVASGLVGYWMVWDERALYVGTAVLEWTGWLPGVGVEAVRNFVDASAVTDRLFSLLAFLHIGLPLMLLLGAWAHLLRLVRAQTMPAQALTIGSLVALAIGSLAWPATSMAAADIGRAPSGIEIDWFYLGALPLADRAPGATWLVLLGATALMSVLPWLVRPKATPAVAVVDPARCNGCTFCFADCPYGAITMVPHIAGHGPARMAVVNADLCASCGICAGACPSATPFRRGATFATGIDMPQRPLAALRAHLDAALDRLAAAPAPRVIVLGCDDGAQLADASGAAMVSAQCVAQWPPVFIEYALRNGADGVLVTGCPSADCTWRLGARLTAERLEGARMPHLRAQVPRERVHVHWALREDPGSLALAVQALRSKLAAASRSTPATQTVPALNHG